MSSYIEDLFSFKGQVAVVSGGTGELCGAMAEGLAGAGAFVYLLGRSEEKAKAKMERIESLGGKSAFLSFEATDRESVESVLETVMFEVMFELPGRDDVKECIITCDFIERKGPPNYVLHRKRA